MFQGIWEKYRQCFNLLFTGVQSYVTLYVWGLLVLANSSFGWRMFESTFLNLQLCCTVQKSVTMGNQAGQCGNVAAFHAAHPFLAKTLYCTAERFVMFLTIVSFYGCVIIIIVYLCVCPSLPHPISSPSLLPHSSIIPVFNPFSWLENLAILPRGGRSPAGAGPVVVRAKITKLTVANQTMIKTSSLEMFVFAYNSFPGFVLQNSTVWPHTQPLVLTSHNVIVLLDVLLWQTHFVSWWSYGELSPKSAAWVY